MVAKNPFAAVNFGAPPDAATARGLFRSICDREPVLAPRVVDKPLALYGAGKLGKMAREYFDRIGIALAFVVDANAELYLDDPFWHGVAIVKPDAVAVKDKQETLLAVCVSTVPYAQLSGFLSAVGWSDFVPFYDISEAYRAVHPLGNGWFCGALGPQEIAATEAVLERWSDDVSRAHHLQFIAWHYLREEWSFTGAPVSADRYFIKEVLGVLHDHEVFLDLGAHVGDTTVKFLQLVKESFAAVWMLEPDAHNLRLLQGRLQRELSGALLDKIKVLSCAVGDSSGSSPFYSGIGYASQLCHYGDTPVAVSTIDDLGIAPTYIKMHLEGGDFNAFLGGVRTIRDCRPIVAATTYHDRLGIWQFPELVLDTLPDYRFFLRQHSWSDTGTVLYAIPEERCAR